ncbi:DUF2202 domain-containing protein [Thermococcus barophilus]|uniref:DUF2202 domain-containing protein n=1 Tax=Thermococcus barophilus (strain DSM 11836 / MP) TaxID=391623 RepID=F0LH28_THEBM|nr:DUF2202 domain-containing protein [Thermococcus barophilus]ADT84236.1 hypothetical protein TERMP_01260 [Thermococcus barophilus MP]
MRKLLALFVIVILLGVVSSSGCVGETKTETATVTDTIPLTADTNGNVNTQELQSYIESLPAGELTEAEKDGLLYMVEEEKLAHDVYTKLYEKWGLQIFSNIAKSETTHVESVRMLLKKYNLPDPTADSKIGEFKNKKLQDLYNKLIEQGMKSEIDALKVGALIEEVDIIDLQERIAETNKLDIITVYENLMMGSRNHLRAFVSQLKNRGVTYEPQVLPKDEYEQIISSPMEKGQGMGEKP